MPYDIYGNNLRNGFCEVHPYVGQEYPCQICCQEIEREKQRQRENRENSQLQNEQYHLHSTLQQIEKLEAEKKEILSILKGLVSDVGNLIGEYDIEWQQAGYFESAKEVIQKHKK